MTSNTNDDTNRNRIDRTSAHSRRKILQTLTGIGVVSGLAGCSSTGSGGDERGVTDTTERAGGGTDNPGGTATRIDTSEPTATQTETPESTPDTSPVSFELLWQEEVNAQTVIRFKNFGADATSDGVFFGADWGFAALALDDGSRMWQNNEWTAFFDIHADSNGVFAYTKSFDVVSLAPLDGTVRWRKSTTEIKNAMFSSALTPSYFVAEAADGLVVYKRDSGAVATTITLDKPPGAVVASDTRVGVLQPGETAVYDIPSGSERWRTSVTMGTGAGINDGRLIGPTNVYGAGAVQLTAIELDTGQEVWRKKVGDASLSGVNIAMGDGVATFMTDAVTKPNTLYAHSLTDGTQLWTKDVGKVRSPFSVIGGGAVIAPAVTDQNLAEIHAYDPGSGKQLDTTSGGLTAFETLTVDRIFLEVGANDVTAKSF